jgi:hypothetical protein
MWFYGRGADISGPVTGPELTDLAMAGTVLPTDTIWQDGVEDGVPAETVDNLFGTRGGPVALRPAAPVLAAPAGTQTAVKKSARAVAGKGVSIVGQDGTTVKYRVKCPTCGREDPSAKSMPIPRGTARVGFFCKKCKKRREADINGYH